MTEYKTYKKKKYKIKYPKNWVVKEGSYDVDVIFLAPTPPFASNVNVNTVDLPPSEKVYTIDEYMEAGIQNMKNVITKADNFIVRKGEISQREARQVTFSGEQGKYKLKFLQVMVLNEQKLHVITYTAEDSQFHESLDITTDMIDSFEIP